MLHSEARFILGDEEYIKTRLETAYDLTLRARLTSNKEHRIKYLLIAFGCIQEVLKLLGVKDWEKAILIKKTPKT